MSSSLLDPDWDSLGAECWNDWKKSGDYLKQNEGYRTPVAFDTETTGFGWFDQLFCVTVAWRRPDGGLASHYLEIESAASANAAIARMILTEAHRLIGHNLRFDLQMVERKGIIEWDAMPVYKWEDTETICHLLNENKRKGLKFVAEHLLGETTNESKDLAAHRRHLGVKKDEGYHVLDRAVLMPYAIKDAEFTLRIWEKLHPVVAAEEELLALYRREMKLMDVLATMYRSGMRVDKPALGEAIKAWSVRLLAAENAVREAGKDEGLNPSSPDQLLAAFKRCGVTTVTETNKDYLAPIAERDSEAGALARAILEYRSVQKIYKTYLIGLRDEIGDEDVFHVNIRQNGAITGRTSSGAEKGDD